LLTVHAARRAVPISQPTPPKVRAFVDLMRELAAARPDMFDYVIPRINVAHGS